MPAPHQSPLQLDAPCGVVQVSESTSQIWPVLQWLSCVQRPEPLQATHWCVEPSQNSVPAVQSLPVRQPALHTLFRQICPLEQAESARQPVTQVSDELAQIW